MLPGLGFLPGECDEGAVREKRVIKGHDYNGLTTEFKFHKEGSERSEGQGKV